MTAEDLFSEMKRYVGFEESDEVRLRALRGRLAHCFTRTIDDFYEHILRHPGARRAITGGDAQVARLKASLLRWIDDCFTGPWDAAYFERHARIGQVHVRIQLPQHYMFCAMSVIRAQLADVLIVDIQDPEEARAALYSMNRMLDVELAIMLHSYADASQAELVAAKDVAERATRTKSDFLANMSHEIRTPMNAVIGLAHLALRTDLTPKQRDYLSKIHNAGTSLLGIINDILDFSKVEAGRIELESTDLDLERVLSQVIALVGQKAHDKGLEMLVRVAPDVPTRLVGDPLRLGQVITNLLNNAVKFTDRGEVRVHVTLEESTGEKAKLRFCVEDTGIGMTPEQSRALFQPFTQADASTTRKHGGTGLGLTISKRLVELMGGQVGFESEAGVGTAFHFTVWLRLGAAGSRRMLVPSELAQLRVLLVDDNAAAREIMAEALHDVTASVDMVASGSEAIEAVRQSDATQPYDVVFMDWRMPGIDGLRAAEHIQAAPLRSRPHILIVTAFGREEVREEAERLALDGVLIKPITRSMLVDSLVTLFAPGREELAEASAVVGAPSLAGARVLLVEDNEINQQIAVELLETAGAAVTIAGNGRIAVERITTAGPGAFDVVLMDLQMPEMDGHQATARIRADERFARLPIVAMTAHATVDERQRCLDEGMVDHVSKPIDPELLLRTVARYHRGPKAQASAAASSPADGDDLGPIPGLDTADGLRRLAGNRALYRKLLAKLATDQRDAAARITACIEASDRDGASRIAHTLKGVAGNLGAKDVQERAAAIEAALARGEAVVTLVAELERALATLVGPLVAALGEHEPAPAPAVASDPARVASVLAQLRAQLSEFDAAVADTVEANRGALAAVLTPAALASLVGAVERYAFDDALAILADVGEPTQAGGQGP